MKQQSLAPNSGYNNITVAGQERPNPSQAEANDYWQDDTGVHVIQIRGGRNVWVQAISPSAEAVIPAGIAYTRRDRKLCKSKRPFSRTG